MKRFISHILLPALILALPACSSSDSGPVAEPDATPIVVGASGPNFSIAQFSRADGHPDDADPDSYTPIKPNTIGVFGEMEGYAKHIFTSSDIFYYKYGEEYPAVADRLQSINEDFTWPADNDWVYAPVQYWSHESNYQFYCYAPYYTRVPEQTIYLDNTLYGAMKTLTIANIPPFSPVDYLVADRYMTNSAGTVTFNMKHVCARICIRMKIGEQYSRLRTIKVTKVTINDRTEATYYNLTSSFTDNPDDLSVRINTTTNSYNPASPEIALIPIFEDPDGLELSPDAYQQYGSLYTMPQEIPSLTINVTYDVYDTDGKKIRSNQKVSNTHQLIEDPVSGRFRSVESGKYYDINIVISPAFLYVLSDNDIKPDILIEPVEP